MKRFRFVLLILILSSVMLGASCITINPPPPSAPTSTPAQAPPLVEPELPPPPKPAYSTEEEAINAVILHLADLTGLAGNDYSFVCNQLRTIYDWSAYLTQDIWSVNCSAHGGTPYIGSWQIDGRGSVTPSDAKAQEQEQQLRSMRK